MTRTGSFIWLAAVMMFVTPRHMLRPSGASASSAPDAAPVTA